MLFEKESEFLISHFNKNLPIRNLDADRFIGKL